MSENEEYSHIRFSESFGKYVDDHLETVFYEVFHDKISDANAVAQLLDPYATGVNEQDAVPFAGALEDTEHAIRWATQFGPLVITKLGKSDIERNKRDGDSRAVAYSGHLANAEQSVYGSTVRQSAILAAIQSLRETADMVLNKQTNDRAH